MARDPFSFTSVKSRARRGSLQTLHGKVQTPLLMPVATRGVVKDLTAEEVVQTGAQIQLSNTYHLSLRPGLEVIAQQGGLHQFNRWQGPILTDSGGYQVYSLASQRVVTEEGVYFKDPASGQKLFLSPEKAIQAQFKLGSDIIMALDDVPGTITEDMGRIREATARTHRWLQRCVLEFQRQVSSTGRTPLLFGIAQGGLDLGLRKHSLEYVQSQPVHGVAIGGLSVGESAVQMRKVLAKLSPWLDPKRPHYLMGVGLPVDLKHAILRGFDMFDCVLPTRDARHGHAWVGLQKKLRLTRAEYKQDERVIDAACGCYTCSHGYSRALIRHLFNVGEYLAGRLVSIHNLYYINSVIKKVIQ